MPGIYGEALEFHGDPDYVTIDGYKGLLGGSAFSIAAWIRTDGNGEIVGWGNNTATQRVEFRVSEYRLRVEHGSGNRQGSTFVSDNKWHHVALTVEANSTMTARGTDIWGTSDEFHFAFKELSGPGSIIAKVESVRNSNNWAKAGVMMRDTLDPDSRHAMMAVTPAQGVSFQRRSTTGDISYRHDSRRDPGPAVG